MRMFSIPQRNWDLPLWIEPDEAPDDWKLYQDYCVQDVEVMRGLVKHMRPLTEEEQEDYAVSEAINDRGLMVDVAFADGAAALRVEERTALAERITQATDGGATKTQGVNLTNLDSPQRRGRSRETYVGDEEGKREEG